MGAPHVRKAAVEGSRSSPFFASRQGAAYSRFRLIQMIIKYIQESRRCLSPLSPLSLSPLPRRATQGAHPCLPRYL